MAQRSSVSEGEVMRTGTNRLREPGGGQRGVIVDGLERSWHTAFHCKKT